jgi:hypothetical protein
MADKEIGETLAGDKPGAPPATTATEAELAGLAEKIRVCVKTSEDYATTAGKHLREARERCREIGLDFNKWCAQAELGIKRSRIYQLMGPDPITTNRRGENHTAETQNIQSPDIVQRPDAEELLQLPAPAGEIEDIAQRVEALARGACEAAERAKADFGELKSKLNGHSELVENALQEMLASAVAAASAWNEVVKALNKSARQSPTRGQRQAA